MEEYKSRPKEASREAMYRTLSAQLQALVEGERHPIPNLANAAALLWGTLDQINWAGFYFMLDDTLVLGPFQGNPACIRISVGRGVCGTAALTGETQLVADVHQFSGHIACDSASNSEIVVPLQTDGNTVGVLDIDSPAKSRFDNIDKAGLEAFARILETACDWHLLNQSSG